MEKVVITKNEKASIALDTDRKIVINAEKIGVIDGNKTQHCYRVQ